MRHVLVVQLARMGDLAQTRRLLLSVAREPETVAHLCVDFSLAGLARLLYPFAEVHGLPAHASSGISSAETLTRTNHALAELAAIPFARVYTLNASPLSLALASLFDPAIVRGHASHNGQAVRSRWCRMAGRWTSHRAASPLNLVDYWGLFHHAPVPPEAVNPLARPARQGRIGIVMAGRQARRSLPPDELAACVQAIFQARNGPALVFIGGKTERPLARQILRRLAPQAAQKVEDTTGSTSLADLPDLLRGLDMLITPDTGAMHLAAHFGVPTQAFFLSSAWCFETGPYGIGHKIWQAATPCAPCLESAPCPHEVACLRPFTHPSFLAHLAGKYASEWPQELMGCISTLDRLGVTYTVVDGEDPHAGERRTLRSSLAEYLDAGSGPDVADERLYNEKDWMLPEYFEEDAGL